MSREPRIRVRLSPRAARRWCPGATRPREQPSEAPGNLGWTAFFRLQGVVGRWRRSGPDSAPPAPALPAASESDSRRSQPREHPEPANAGASDSAGSGDRPRASDSERRAREDDAPPGPRAEAPRRGAAR